MYYVHRDNIYIRIYYMLSTYIKKNITNNFFEGRGRNRKFNSMNDLLATKKGSDSVRR